MNKVCSNLKHCRFFKIYKENEQFIAKAWQTLYCEDLRRSDECARKKFFNENESAPPDNLTPEGDYLEED